MENKNLEKLTVHVELTITSVDIYLHLRKDRQQDCLKVLVWYVKSFFKYTTLECKGSGLNFFDNHLLSTWSLFQFLLFRHSDLFSSQIFIPQHKSLIPASFSWPFYCMNSVGLAPGWAKIPTFSEILKCTADDNTDRRWTQFLHISHKTLY